MVCINKDVPGISGSLHAIFGALREGRSAVSPNLGPTIPQ